MTTTAETEIQTKKLLVVDDDPAILKLLKTLLTRAKYRVSGCGSGGEALKLLSQSQYDLMITDAIMPEMNGFDLVRAIRSNPSFDPIPILMLTRKNDRSDVKRALAAGVTDYLLKPIDEHLLIDKVEVSLKSQDPGNRLREVALHGEACEAQASLDAKIVSVRETGMVVRLPFDIPTTASFHLNTPIFDQMGIKPPIMKMISSQMQPSPGRFGEADLFKDFPCQAEFAFIGLIESELMRIRAWLHRQEIQRKK